jgi:hypothetical protein
MPPAPDPAASLPQAMTEPWRYLGAPLRNRVRAAGGSGFFLLYKPGFVCYNMLAYKG